MDIGGPNGLKVKSPTDCVYTGSTGMVSSYSLCTFFDVSVYRTVSEVWFKVLENVSYH